MNLILRLPAHLSCKQTNAIKNPWILVSVVLFAVVIESCGTVYIDATNVGKEVVWTDSVNRPYTVIRHFCQERKAYFTVIGLFKLRNPDIAGVIRDEITGVQGDAVINTKLEVECDLIDTIVPYGIGAVGWALLGPIGFNLSLAFNTQTYRLSGDVIRYVK